MPARPKGEGQAEARGIRKEILQARLTFAAAANKYSEDPANAGGAGGDLDYFTLDSGFVEEFADAAFKLKKGEISRPRRDPVRLPPDPGHRPQGRQAARLRAEQAVHRPGLRKRAPARRSSPPSGSRPRSTSSRCPRTSSRPEPPRRCRRHGADLPAAAPARPPPEALIGSRSAITGPTDRVVPRRAGPRIGGRSRRSLAERGRRDRPEAGLEAAVVEVRGDRELAVAVGDEAAGRRHDLAEGLDERFDRLDGTAQVERVGPSNGRSSARTKVAATSPTYWRSCRPP